MSIRRDRIEGEFETLLRAILPATLFEVAGIMFKDLWNHRLKQAEAEARALGAQLLKIGATAGKNTGRAGAERDRNL